MIRKVELIEYRMKKAMETYSEIPILLDNNLYRNAGNRLYYSCFYAVSALLLKKDYSPKTHLGMRRVFSEQYIKTGLISKEHGTCFNDLYELRQTGDYDDFIEVTKEMVEDLYEPAKSLIDEIDKFINLEK